MLALIISDCGQGTTSMSDLMHRMEDTGLARQEIDAVFESVSRPGTQINMLRLGVLYEPAC